ncbi:MAG TPA: hypothetical protein VFD12_04490 [Oligella sp.]|nr:hypothetical protein [Oligella sp.]
MSRLSQFQRCTCQKMYRSPELCDEQFAFEENDKRVCCKPKNGEQVTAIQMDGCVIMLDLTGNLESLLEVSGSKHYGFDQVDICNGGELKSVLAEHELENSFYKQF